MILPHETIFYFYSDCFLNVDIFGALFKVEADYNNILSSTKNFG